MTKYFSISVRDGILISKKALLADTFLSRLIGLTFRKTMPEDEALIFYKAPAIHTFFMRFSFDLVFLDRENKIMRICESIKPNRQVFCLGSTTTIEFPPGTVSRKSLKVGDVLELTPLKL